MINYESNFNKLRDAVLESFMDYEERLGLMFFIDEIEEKLEVEK